MIDKIYEFAKNMNDEDVVPKGYYPRTLYGYLVFSEEGEFLYVEKNDPKDPIKAICPDLGSKAFSSSNCNFLCEKWYIIFNSEKTKRREFYLNLLKECSEFEPLLKIIYDFICKIVVNSEELDKLIKENFNSKNDNTYISYKIGNQKIEELESWKKWYDDFYKKIYINNKKENNIALSLLSGKEIVPLNNLANIKGTGLNRQGDYLLSFYGDSYCSYNLKDACNSPINEEEQNLINKGFLELCKNHSNNIGNNKMIHWYKEGKNEDIIDSIFEEDDFLEDKEKLATEIVDSIQEPKNIDIIKDDIYYTFFVTSNRGRIRMLNNYEGSYISLKNNLNKWIKDTSLGKYNKKLIPYRIFKELLFNIDGNESESIRFQKEYGNNMINLIFSIMDNRPIPDVFFLHSLEKIKKNIYNSNKNNSLIIYRILKSYLIRHYEKKGETNYLMENLNKNNPNVGYQCGRMFAVFEALQQEAMPKNNTSVTERYYISASSTPELIFGVLTKQSSIYFGKLDNKGKEIRYKKMLQEISQNIEAFPKTLDLLNQAQFALGYYQQRNYIYTKKEENNNEE